MAPYSAQGFPLDGFSSSRSVGSKTTGQLPSYNGSQQCISTSEEIARSIDNDSIYTTALFEGRRRSRVNKTRSSVIDRLHRARMLKKNLESVENAWTSQTKKDTRSKFTVKTIGMAFISYEDSALKERCSSINKTRSSVIGRLHRARMSRTNSESVENARTSQTKKIIDPSLA